MVIAAPHAKEIDATQTTPSPTPPVAAIATTLQPPVSTQDDLMGKINDVSRYYQHNHDGVPCRSTRGAN